MILDISPKYYIIRTSWLFGKHGKNFVETMLRLAEENKDIKVVNDQFGSPTYAKDLAAEVRKLVESQNPYGIYHVTNSETCSWYDFKRPIYSMLINTKLPPMRKWEEALKDYLK
jgi:dTDP-4-dehydrorhamnose reductase